MNVEDLKTDKQLEKIYYCNDHNSNEQIQEQMRSFINELCQRRRDDPKEEGLQAGMLIMPSAFAAKITENDGKYPHGITNINLLRFIKKEKGFYVGEASSRFGIITNELSELIRNGIEIRIIDGEQNLMMAINSKQNIQTIFQLTVLKRLIDELWSIKQNELYKSIEVGFYSPISEIDVDDLNEEVYSRLIEAIETEKDKLEERNKEKDEGRNSATDTDNEKENLIETILEQQEKIKSQQVEILELKNKRRNLDEQ